MTLPASDTTTDRLALARKIERLESERRELWLWVEHLERLAEAGLHARGLAHDLGNSLTAIMASSELATMQSDPAEHRRAVEVNLTHAKTAAERLHTYTAFSRRDDPGLGPVRVATVIEDAVRFLAHTLRKADVEVDRRLAVDPLVRITHPRLLQVLTHALSTLIQGSRNAGGRVRVGSRMDGRELVVDLRRVANPDVARTEGPECPVGSTGFELHLAREILDRAGGRILGEPDDGLTGTVRLVLPVVTNDKEDARPARDSQGSELLRGAPTAWRAWSGGWTRS